jgi:hypothetical protein
MRGIAGAGFWRVTGLGGVDGGQRRQYFPCGGVFDRMPPPSHMGILMSEQPSSPTIKTPIKKKVFILLPSISENTANWFHWAGNVVVSLATFVGFLAAVGALWGDRVREYYSDQRTANTELQTQNAKLAADQAKLDAAQAYQRAAQANQRAAEAQKRAAELEMEAEQERSLRQALAAQTAPRVLTNDQSVAFSKALSLFGGQTVDVVALGAGSEGEALALQISSLLGDAKWDARALTITEAGMLAPSGIIVMERPWSMSGMKTREELEKRSASANALIAALKAQGIAVSDQVYRIDVNGNEARNEMYIGWRPFHPMPLTKFMTGGRDWSNDTAAPIRVLIGPRN